MTNKGNITDYIFWLWVVLVVIGVCTIGLAEVVNAITDKDDGKPGLIDISWKGVVPPRPDLECWAAGSYFWCERKIGYDQVLEIP